MKKLTHFLRAEARDFADIMVIFAVAVLFIMPLGALLDRYLYDLAGVMAVQPRGVMWSMMAAYMVGIITWFAASFWAAVRLVRWTYRAGTATAPRYALVVAGADLTALYGHYRLTKEEADAILSDSKLKIYRP
ncbi:hypothetical protein [Cupriavidus pampae]|uniref:Uncharacterized protein n=1 Tax=Cupriavidus pampae TaxID=659251 RepID=A0ABN7ZCT6_9BURK|nr:hypothetical protein [Cupriavidus pampae]CAG9183793.1 hypothetical protein LMG32289_05422 [Cupriavidus pampae]